MPSVPAGFVQKLDALALRRLLRRADVRVVHLLRELETRDRFLEMGLERGDHDEHECFRVPAERVLEEVCQLRKMISIQ